MSSSQSEEPQIDKASLLLTDSKGPFLGSPPIVQEIITSCYHDSVFDPKLFDPTKLGFPIKKTKNNTCSYFISNDQKVEFYVCSTCLTTSNLIICKDCFELDKHEGHDFKLKEYGRNSFCDCGRIEAIKKEGICEKHSHYSDELECEILEEEEKIFIACFQALFNCIAYLDEKEFRGFLDRKVSRYLCELNESSIYYNRLTMKLLENPPALLSGSDEIKTEQNRFVAAFVLMFIYERELLVHMNGDLKTRKQMIKFTCWIANILGREKVMEERNLNISELFSCTAVDQLMSEGYDDPFFNYVVLIEMEKKFEISKDAERIFTTKLKESVITQNISYNYEIRYLLKNIELCEAAILRAIEIYPYQEGEEFIKLPLVNNSYTDEINLPGIVAAYNNGMSKGSVLILRCITTIGIEDIEIFKNIRQYLFSKGVCEDDLDHIIEFAMLQICHEILYIEEKEHKENMNNILVSLFALFKDSRPEKKFVDKFWNILLQSHNPEAWKEKNKKSQLSFSEINIHVDTFYYIINHLMRFDLIRTIKMRNNPEGKKEFLQNFLKTYMCERNCFTLDNVMELKDIRLLNFEESSKILDQYCTYDEIKQKFTYTSPEDNFDFVQRFPIVPTKLAWNNMYSMQLKYGEELILQKDSIAELFLGVILNTDIIPNLLEEEWYRFTRTKVGNDGRHYGYLFIFNLVLIDVLQKGKNTQLREKLALLKTKEILESFYTNEVEKNLILNMFTEKEERKNKVLTSKELLDIQRNGSCRLFPRTCIICSKDCLQIADKEPDFVYLGLASTQTLSSAVVGDNCFTKTFISTDFHTIHTNCISLTPQRISREPFLISCKFCSSKMNCFLPLVYDPEKSDLNNICYNSIVLGMASLSTKIIGDEMIILILKHLIESRGLTPIVQGKYADKKEKTLETKLESQKYLEGLMLDIYRRSTEEERREIDEKVEDLIGKINEVSREECRLVQLIFAKMYQSYLSNTEFIADTSEFLRLEQIIISDEYETFMREVNKFKNVPLQISEASKDDQNKKSLSYKKYELHDNFILALVMLSDKECYYGDHNNAKIICLICSEAMCDQCFKNHCIRKHGGVTFILSVTIRLVVLQKFQKLVHNVYFSEFKIPASKGLKGENRKWEEFAEYNLDVEKYERLFESFVEDGKLF